MSKVDSYRYLKRETHPDINNKKNQNKHKIKLRKNYFKWSETAFLDFKSHPPTCQLQDKKCLFPLHCPVLPFMAV